MDTSTEHRLSAWLPVLLLFLMTACGSDRSSAEPTHRHTTPASTCDSGPGERTLEVTTNAVSIGANANAFLYTEGATWVVESGDNTVSPIGSGPVIDVGNGRNPYDAAYDPITERVFITNFQSDTVSVADPQTGEILEELDHDSLDRPNGVAVSNRYVYVTNTAFRPGSVFDEGSVTVIDPSSLEVLGTIETERKNPQFATWTEAGDTDRLIVVDTGPLTYDAGDFSAGDAAVEVWEETQDPRAPDKTVAPLNVGDDPDVGAPGRAVVTLDGRRAYFTSATAAVLFELDLTTGEWLRGAEDPITLYETDQDALDHAALGEDGVLYVSAFNREQLILLDTRCNAIIGRYDISAEDILNAGPHGITINRSDADSAQGFIIGSISNALLEFSIE